MFDRWWVSIVQRRAVVGCDWRFDNLRLATSRLANIFGNGTMYSHDKNLERAKTPEINQIYRINPSAEGVSELRSAERTRTRRNRAKDFAKVYDNQCGSHLQVGHTVRFYCVAWQWLELCAMLKRLFKPRTFEDLRLKAGLRNKKQILWAGYWRHTRNLYQTLRCRKKTKNTA